MERNIISAALAASVGFFVAFINYCLSKHVLVKAPEKYSFVTVVRQVIQIGFLAAVYFIGKNLQSADLTYLLVGAVVGMTLPMIYFTKKLLAVNENASGKSNGNEKGDETDG